MKGSKGKQIGIFIVVLVFLIVLMNVLVHFVSPVKPVRFVSWSMEPAYHYGDVLFYQRVPKGNYKVGDVIIYDAEASTAEEQIVVRIIEENDDGTFIVKGDANPGTLEHLDQNNLRKEQIIGKVLFGMQWYIYYPVLYLILIIVALLITRRVCC